MDTPSTLYVRPPIWALLAVVIIGGAFYLVGKHLEARNVREPAVISVSADAKVSAVPDTAELAFGMATGRQPSAKAAMSLLTKNMNAVIDAVKQLDIADKDIQTEHFNLNPVYDYTQNGQFPRGFEASESLRVKIHDLDKVGDVLTAATGAGANQAGSVTFTIDNPDALQAKARAEAIEKAQEKAKKLASDLGVHLGQLRNFSENSGAPPPIFYDRMGMGGPEMKATEVAPLPVPAGQQEIRVTVNLTYEVD